MTINAEALQEWMSAHGEELIAQVMSDSSVVAELKALESVLTDNPVMAEASLQAEIYAGFQALLDKADAHERTMHQRTLDAAVDAAAKALAEAEGRVPVRQVALDAAVQADRDAEDQARQADDYRRELAEALHRAQTCEVSPAEEVRHMQSLRDAAEVAVRYVERYQGTTRARDEAATNLRLAQEDVSRRTDELATAKHNAANPGPAPKSASRLYLLGPYELIFGNLTEDEMRKTGALVEIMAIESGIAEKIRRSERESIMTERKHSTDVWLGSDVVRAPMPRGNVDSRVAARA